LHISLKNNGPNLCMDIPFLTNEKARGGA